MHTSRNSLAGAYVLAAAAAVTGCGGGGDEEVLRAVPGTAPAETQTRAATTAALPRPMNDGAPSGAVPSPAAAGPVVHRAILVDPLVADRVQAELDQVEQGLQVVPDTDPGKHEALEVIRDLRRELDKDQPNRLKVRGLLGGLAQGVSSLEGWRGAGKFLRQLIPLV